MQRVFLGPIMATRRTARNKHRCSKCGHTINETETYYATSKRLSETEIEHSAICEECWTGPKLDLKSKQYKYRPKESAKSDGVIAVLRLNKERRMFEF